MGGSMQTPEIYSICTKTDWLFTPIGRIDYEIVSMKWGLGTDETYLPNTSFYYRVLDL